MEENRKKALAAALGQIEKQFGKGSVMRLGDATASYDVESVSTGSLGLDIALGIGGLPRGRVVEIFGPESSGPNCRRPARAAGRRCRVRYRVQTTSGYRLHVVGGGGIAQVDHRALAELLLDLAQRRRMLACGFLSSVVPGVA